MRLLSSACVALGLYAATGKPAHASLLGTSVTGSMTVPGSPGFNLFDPNNGFVPSGYGNASGTTTTIGSGIEFGYEDSGDDVITVDLTDTGFTLSYSLPNELPLLATTFTLTDTAFAGLKLTQVSDTFASLQPTLKTDVITLKVGKVSNASALSATFTVLPPASVPEPASLALLGLPLGILVVQRWAGWQRRSRAV